MIVNISPKAEKQLKKISKIDQIAIANKIRSIKNSPANVLGEEKLSGNKNIFRVRIGNYRIVYRKKIKVTYIILIGHRKDIYHLLQHLFG